MSLTGKELSFGYQRDKPLFSNVSISLKPSQVVGIHGYSGSGKTTLGKVLAGYLRPWQGRIWVDDTPVVTRGFNPVQMIHQHPEKSLNPLWRMSQVLAECDQQRDDIMEKFGIRKDWLNRWPIELSGGEMQRFCVARAFDSRTRYIIADEITTMLDGITQAAIWRTILQEAKQRAIGLMVISHDMALLHQLSDEIIDFDTIVSSD